MNERGGGRTIITKECGPRGRSNRACCERVGREGDRWGRERGREREGGGGEDLEETVVRMCVTSIESLPQPYLFEQVGAAEKESFVQARVRALYQK